jgi:hypothetical protein
MQSEKKLKNRNARRQPVLELGLIKFGETSINCVLRNVSKTGAALDVGPYIDIADHFTLIVLPGQKIFSCEVVWRSERRIGVSFGS